MRTWLDRFGLWDAAALGHALGLQEARVWRPLLRGVSFSADGWFYPAFPLLLWRAAGPAEALRFVAGALLGLAVVIPSFKWLKRRVQRSRPFEADRGVPSMVVPGDAFSFPSGHTATATLMATLTAGWLPALGLPLLAWASLVALSRVVLGVHYPSDVAAGALLGGGSGWLALAVLGA